jgi:guanine deaminase
MASVAAAAAGGGKRCLLGGIIHSLRLGVLETITNGAIIYNQHGVIEQVLDLNQNQATDPLVDIPREHILDYRGKLILPGFVDSHCHAPQYVFTGTGIDMDLMAWLQTYTFPIETKFSDLNYAKYAYTKSVERHLKNGTTFAAYYATIHKEAALLLTEIINSVGQRAFVGKVAMDQNSPESYIESTEESIAGTEEFLRAVLAQTTIGSTFLSHIDQEITSADTSDLSPSAFSLRPSLLNTSTCPLVLPCITPRFVPTCTSTSLAGLGRLSHKYGLPVQSHISESLNEINFVRSLHPDSLTYGHIYHQHGLLHRSSLLGHCVHCSDLELELLQTTQTSAIHCASSNFLLGSGIMDVRRFLEAGVSVGLGTDVAGGASTSMLDCIRNTISASRAMGMKKRGDGIPPPFSLLPKDAPSVEELTTYRSTFPPSPLPLPPSLSELSS